MEHSFKNTVLHDCELPYEVFHLQRRTNLVIRQQLSRIGFLVNRSGQLELKSSNLSEESANKTSSYMEKGKSVDFSGILKELLPEWEARFDLGSQFAKPDYFLPMGIVEGLHSAD